MSVLKGFSLNMPIFEKYFFYMFNLYLVLRGICTTAWATKIYLYKYLYLNWESIENSLKTLIIIGSVLIIFALCGGGYSILYFDNAKFRNGCTYTICTTLMFALLFLIILIVQSAVTIYMLIRVSNVITNFKEAFMNYVYHWKDAKIVNDIQENFYCCGIYSYDDYQTIHNILIPGSCCHNFEICSEIEAMYRPGCVFTLNASPFLHNIYTMSIFSLIVIVAELVVFIFALCLTNSIRKRNAMKSQETRVTSLVNNTNLIFPVYS